MRHGIFAGPCSGFSPSKKPNMKMTTGLVSKALFLVLAATALSLRAQAQITVSPGYSISTYYTHTATAADIVSFDWDASSNLYYLTDDDAVWQTSGGTPTNIYTAPAATADDAYFSGASVTTIGNYVYFNDSDYYGEYIHAYGPLAGSPSVSLVSSASNYALLGHNGALFITGTDSNGSNNIYYSTLNTNGTLASGPTSLGVTGGDSGPLAFDSAGDLYYAPGYGDLDIYKWSAAEVAAAISNPTLDPLSESGHLWESYSAQYSSVAGATSMLVAPDGDLLLTLTNFSGPSDLVDFGVNPNGSANGAENTVLTDGGLLGEIRELDNNVYVAADNEIVQIVPEPATAFLAGLGGMMLAFRRRRKT